MKRSLAFFCLVAVLALKVSNASAQTAPIGGQLSAPSEPPTMTSPPTQGTDNVQGSLDYAKVSFVEPRDGAEVTSPVAVKLSVSGLKTMKAGEVVPGAGHFHILVDTPALAKGKAIPSSSKHQHLNDGQSETTLKLAKGKHKLTVQFSDGRHRSYGEQMSETIEITVK